jgi:organic hydroperoxide reductase OsmC/OhrA
MATDMAHKADMYCIVTNAVRDKVEVTIEPNVVRA